MKTLGKLWSRQQKHSQVKKTYSVTIPPLPPIGFYNKNFYLSCGVDNNKLIEWNIPSGIFKGELIHLSFHKVNEEFFFRLRNAKQILFVKSDDYPRVFIIDGLKRYKYESSLEQFYDEYE